MWQPVARVVVLLSLLCLERTVDGYSSGAPESACADLIPQHGVTAQTSSPPFELVHDVSGDEVEALNS